MADEPVYSIADRTGYFNQPGASFGGGGSVGRGPQCAEGYQPGPNGQGCVKTPQKETQDLLLDNLKRASGSVTTAPKSLTSSALPPIPGGGAGAGGAGGGGYSFSMPSTGGAGSVAGSDMARIAHPDSKPLSDAALLRAKDRQGQIARSSLSGLRSVLGERQMLGSGAEGAGMEQIAANALGSLTDVNREQLIQEDQNAEANTLAGYQGDVSQRATDIGSRNALASLAVAARGQDIGANVAYRGQDITARGQDISANSLAAQQYNQQVQAVLEALRSQLY